jgi:hypothetical protein
MANGSAVAILHHAAGAIMPSSNFLVHRPIMVVSPFRRHHPTLRLKRCKNAKHSLSKVENAFFSYFNKTRKLNVNAKYILLLKFDRMDRRGRWFVRRGAQASEASGIREESNCFGYRSSLPLARLVEVPEQEPA